MLQQQVHVYKLKLIKYSLTNQQNIATNEDLPALIILDDEQLHMFDIDNEPLQITKISLSYNCLTHSTAGKP